MPARLAALLLLMLLAAPARAAASDGVDSALPVVTPGDSPRQPPSDAIVLFDGTDFSQWTGGRGWTIQDGEAVVGDSWLVTKRAFGDCQVHVEWAAPSPAEPYEGARRGNSGVHLMMLYEFQIMDAFRNPTDPNRTAGAIYKQAAPAANAVRPPGEWNMAELFWLAPRFAADGSLERPGRLTATVNGVLIHHHSEVLGKTSHKEAPAYRAHEPRRPFSLQSHSSPVRFRNIWARDFEPAGRLAKPSD